MLSGPNTVQGRNALYLLACGVLYLAAQSSARASDLLFADACTEGKRVVIAAVGDLIFQPPIQSQIDDGQRSYRSLWRRVEPVLARADVVYGNLEGPVAKKGGHADVNAYDRPDHPLVFNYSPSLLDDLVGSGFSVVSTANNHALDRGSRGIDHTIMEIEARGLAFTGTRRSGDARSPWSAITKGGGMRIAWIACTYGTNGRPDGKAQVLHCDEQRAEVLREIGRLTEDATIDAVILAPHWGLENTPLVEPGQEALARQAIERGATAVIGAHPHVLQRWEKYTLPMGGEGLVIYSLGNFISAQPSLEQRTGAIALIELVKPYRADKARVAAARYILTHISPQPDYSVTESKDQYAPKGLPEGNRISIAGTLATALYCPAP